MFVRTTMGGTRWNPNPRPRCQMERTGHPESQCRRVARWILRVEGPELRPDGQVGSRRRQWDLQVCDEHRLRDSSLIEVLGQCPAAKEVPSLGRS